MFKLHDSLPFSGITFYFFILLSFIGLLSVKLVLDKEKSYKFSLFFISVFYLILLFPKPLHLLFFVSYGFLIFKFLGQKFKLQGFKIVLIYVLPLFFMKLSNVITKSHEQFELIASIFQIAGLSYATFKMIQTHIDEAENTNVNFITYFTFISFPPTLLIGPIDRYKRFSDNLEFGFGNITKENINQGLNSILKGLVYKYILAYALSKLVLDHLNQFTGFAYHSLYMYTYLFYLFFDFAGYSLLAIGYGMLLGIKVPINFDKPFLAQNPKEFWYRWHKSLGDWLNDYFFKPIFKYLTSEKILTPIKRQSIALLLTFTLMGLWNGFELHFILSGLLFGLYSMGYNYYNYQCKKQGKDVIFKNMNVKYVNYISIFILFHLVAFSIYIFSGKLI